MNFTPGQTIAGLIVVKLGADHRSFKIFNASNAPLDVAIDEFGYTSVYENSAGSDFTAVNPARILDTRSSPCTPNCGQLTGTHAVSLFTQGGLPWNGLTAVAVTLTAVSATGAGVISVFPHGDTGNTSNLNYTSGQTVANSVIVKVPSGGQIDLVISGAATDVLIDVVGYYSTAINTWTYTYNSDGLRITKTGPPCCAWLNATTSFTYDAYGNLLREFTAGWPAASISYIYGPDGLPVEQVDINGNVKYIHHDRLGSTRAITKADGSVAGTYSYDAYGKQTASWFAPAAHLGYTGQYHDNSQFDTGFIYMRARFYDPTTGQFLSRDPVNFLTRSAYGYVGNQPVNAVDPTGLCGFTDPLGCVSAGAAIVSTVLNQQSNPGDPTSYDPTSPTPSPAGVGGNSGPTIRAPDYLTIDYMGFWPVVGPFGPGGGVNLTISRSGQIYYGPQVGVGAGVGADAKLGWLNRDGAPSSEEVDNFLDGGFVNAGGCVGPGGGVNISSGGDTSTELGGGQPGGAAVAGYSWSQSIPWLKW